jgi:hypothetical protein
MALFLSIILFEARNMKLSKRGSPRKIGFWQGDLLGQKQVMMPRALVCPDEGHERDGLLHREQCIGPLPVSVRL